MHPRENHFALRLNHGLAYIGRAQYSGRAECEHRTGQRGGNP
jgi:hypothetical protein